MPANKDQKRGTWVCRFEYKDWKGETRTVYKRGFLTRRDAVQYEMDFKLRLAGDLDMSFACGGDGSAAYCTFNVFSVKPAYYWHAGCTFVLKNENVKRKKN